MDGDGHDGGPDVDIVEHWEGRRRVVDQLNPGRVDHIIVLIGEHVSQVGRGKVVLGMLDEGGCLNQ